MNAKSLLLSGALVVGLVGAAFGQSSTSPSQQDPASPTTQAPSTQSPTTTQQPGEMSPTSTASQGQHSFTGNIVKSSGKYMLHSAGADYRLDDQKQAKEFNGKQVKVMGDLDQSTNTIKVQSIEPSSSM